MSVLCIQKPSITKTDNTSANLKPCQILECFLGKKEVKFSVKSNQFYANFLWLHKVVILQTLLKDPFGTCMQGRQFQAPKIKLKIFWPKNQPSEVVSEMTTLWFPKTTVQMKTYSYGSIAFRSSLIDIWWLTLEGIPMDPIGQWCPWSSEGTPNIGVIDIGRGRLNHGWANVEIHNHLKFTDDFFTDSFHHPSQRIPVYLLEYLKWTWRSNWQFNHPLLQSAFFSVCQMASSSL